MEPNVIRESAVRRVSTNMHVVSVRPTVSIRHNIVWPSISIAISLVAVLLLPAYSRGEFREWTYRSPTSGRETKYKAEYAGMKGLAVLIKTENGKLLKPELPDLSPNDQAYVEKLSKASGTDLRIWKGPRGEVEARYVGIRGRMVVLESKSGTPLNLAWGGLNPGEQAHIVELQKSLEARRIGQIQSANQWQPAASGVEVMTLNPNDTPNMERRIDYLEFSPDSTLLFSRSLYGPGAIWDIVTRKKQCDLSATVQLIDSSKSSGWSDHLHVQFNINSLHPSRRELWYLPWETESVVRFDVTTGQVVGGVVDRNDESCKSVMAAAGNCKISAMRFSRDGSTLILGMSPNEDEVDAVLVNAETMKLQEALSVNESRNQSSTRRLDVSANGDIVAAEKDGCVRVWNLATHQQHSFKANCLLKLIDNGRLIATAGDWQLKIFSTDTGNPEVSLNLKDIGHANGSESIVAVSPVGTHCAIAHRGQSDVVLVDWRTGRSLATLTGHANEVSAVTFADDGSLLATVDCGGTVKVWNLTDLNKSANDQCPNDGSGKCCQVMAAGAAAGSCQSARHMGGGISGHDRQRGEAIDKEGLRNERTCNSSGAQRRLAQRS